MQTFEAPFPRGTCPIHVFGVLEQSGPAVIMFPDAFGPRPAAYAVAEAIASNGWRVLMTTPFYEFAPFEPIDPASIFGSAPGREKFMGMFKHVTPETIDADAAAALAFAAEHCGTDSPLATVGYCMGGRYAFSAACASEQVRFAGAFHAGHLAPAEGDGPHKRFAQAKGRLYAGVAGIDAGVSAEEQGRLAQALREADADHVIETYHGVGHGWVYEDLPVYNRAAADRHQRRIAEHFSEVLGG
jgi:carboxymethylenebutenolidase